MRFNTDMHGEQQNILQWRRWVFLMGCCLFALATLSYFRLWFIGTPNLDGLPMIMPWEITRRTIFFFLMLGAGWSFYKLMTQELPETELKKLFFSSLALQFITSLTLPLTSNDIFANLAYGRMSQLGLDVNHLGASALPLGDPFRAMVTARWMDMPTPYGHIISWLNRLITQPDDLWTSIIIYKALALFFCVIVTALVFIYCRRHLEGLSRCSSFILFALNPVFLWELASQAHNDSLMIIGVLGFVLLITGNRPWAALACILVTVFTKMAVLPVLGLYLCYTFFNSKKRFALFCALLVAGGLIFAGSFSEKLSTILVADASHGVNMLRITHSPLFLVHKLLLPFSAGVQTWGYRIYWLCAMLFMAILGLRFAWKCRAREQLFLYSLLFILLFSFIASPTYQPWYVTWLLPFAITLDDKRLRSFIVFYSVVSVTQYAILNSFTGSIINLILLGIFWAYYWRVGAASVRRYHE